MTPEQLAPDDPRLPDVFCLIQRVFGEHAGRIDPPSSMHRMTEQSLQNAAEVGELWVTGSPPVACVVLTVQGDALYLSKLAVAATMRGTGLARTLIETAERRARARSLVALEAQTRVELTENYVIFRALGFEIVGQTAHPGYDRPTSITLRKPL